MHVASASDLDRLSLDALHSLKHQVGGAALERVEAAIRRKASPAPEAPAEDRPRHGSPEKDEQRGIRRDLVKIGCKVYWLSQPRQSFQTAGVPDLLVFHARLGFFVVEAKAPGGTQSPAQREFQAWCETTGVPYVLGDRAAVAEWTAAALEEMGAE